MSVALRAVAWAWRFKQSVKWLTSFQGTWELWLPGPLEPGELQLPGVQSTKELFYCLYDKNFVLILICELSIWNFRLIALKLTYVDLCQDQGKKGNDSPVSKVPGSRFKSAITQWKSKKK